MEEVYFVECTIFVLLTTFFWAWYTNSITDWPTEISRIGGTTPAYYVFAPGITVIACLLFHDLYLVNHYSFFISTLLCGSLSLLAIVDHYSLWIVHATSAFIFFMCSISLLYPYILTYPSCFVAFFCFVLRILLLGNVIVGFDDLIIFKIRSLLQWILVVSLLISFPLLPLQI